MNFRMKVRAWRDINILVKKSSLTDRIYSFLNLKYISFNNTEHNSKLQPNDNWARVLVTER